jgi:hypothetical protein
MDYFLGSWKFGLSRITISGTDPQHLTIELPNRHFAKGAEVYSGVIKATFSDGEVHMGLLIGHDKISWSNETTWFREGPPLHLPTSVVPGRV